MEKIFLTFNFLYKVFWFCVQVYNISIPGIVPSSGTNWGTNSAICSVVYDTNDILQSPCGRWDATDTRMIPQGYLPSGCNCTSTIPSTPVICP